MLASEAYRLRHADSRLVHEQDERSRCGKSSLSHWSMKACSQSSLTGLCLRDFLTSNCSTLIGWHQPRRWPWLMTALAGMIACRLRVAFEPFGIERDRHLAHVAGRDLAKRPALEVLQDWRRGTGPPRPA